MTLIGRRVDTLEDLEQPGDYVVLYAPETQAIRCLWFIMPEGTQGRIAAEGHGQVQTFGGQPEPEWTITEDGEGVVSVEPSIDYPGVWHGHLRAGVWTGA